jgi:tyrosine-protein kinase Etk/Wzc
MELRERTDEVGISDYFRVLYRRRWVAILTFAVVMLSVSIHTFLATPQFEASGLIEIQDQKSRNNLLDDFLTIGTNVPVAAEMEVLKSRSLAELVVRELRFDLRIFDQSTPKLKVDLLDAEMHNRLKGKVFRVEFIDLDGGFEISADKLGDLGTGTVGEPFQVEDLAFRLSASNFEPGDSFRFLIYPFRQAVSAIQGRTEVRNLGDNTGLVRIFYRSQYPEQARDIVNKIVEVYRRKNVEEKSAEASQTLDFIQNQLNVVKTELSVSEKDLNRYKEDHGVMLLDAEAAGLIENVAEFEVEKSQLQLEKFQYEALLAALNSNEMGFTLPNFSRENNVLSNLGLQLVEAQSNLEMLLADLTPKHPQAQALQSQIDDLRANIRGIVKNTIQSLAAREKSLDQVLDKYNGMLRDMPAKERELAELKRNTMVAAEIYTFLLEKFEEARIAKAATTSNIRIIDTAIVPQGAISPNLRLNLMLGLIAGLLLSIGVAFFLEFIDDSLKTVEEVERTIRKPIYGIIPRIPETTLDDAGDPIPSQNLVTHHSPKSPISEAFRTMRTNIHFADPDQTMATLLITSAGPSEGKSTIVANLAITIANTGRKTLLVDCDLRKPKLHTLFEHQRDSGLTTALAGGAPWQSVLKDTQVENLRLLTSGPIPPNPTEIVASQAMKDIIEDFKTEFDFILFDSPPVVAVTDAAILSTYTSGTLMVVELGRSRGSAVNRALDLLAKVNANLLGIVTNNIAIGYKYDYGYYSSYYYYSDGEKKKKKKGRGRYGF